MSYEAWLESMERQLIDDEGWRSKPYRCTSGHLTIGVGHRMLPHEITHPIDAIEWDSAKIFKTLRSDLHLAIRGCEMIFGREKWNTLSPRRQAALTNMAFQMGAGKLRGFRKMINAIFAEQWETAHAEALDSRWARQTPARANRVAKLLLEG